jgi:signal peptidase
VTTIDLLGHVGPSIRRRSGGSAVRGHGAGVAHGRHRTSRARAWSRRVGSLLSSLALAMTLAAFAFLAVGPHVLGYRTATMLTASMAPVIDPGDVVVTVPRPAGAVAVGDVISYHIPVEDHRVETHRVVKVTRDAAGRLAVVTKGDANNGADPWVATLEGATVYEVRTVVPHLGTVIRALRTPVVQGGLFWAALGGTVLIGLWRIWRGGAAEAGSNA